MNMTPVTSQNTLWSWKRAVRVDHEGPGRFVWFDLEGIQGY